MTNDQINQIQSYQGDMIEEYWKPGPLRSSRTYVDLFHFWQFREQIRACGLEHLRPTEGNSISRAFIFKHERLASYYYTAYCRTATLHHCISDLEQAIINKGPLLHFNVQNAFETFYLFAGSTLDNIAGVSNIMLGYANSEDSFSDFLRSFRADNASQAASPDALRLFEAAKDINDNYRAQVAHRGRLGTLWVQKLNVLAPYAQADFDKPGPAIASISWRKELREMMEGRTKAIPMTQLCFQHLRTFEQAIDEIFRISIGHIDSYLHRHGAKFAADSSQFGIDLQTRLAEAKWILYRCNEEPRPYLNVWFHDLSKGELPQRCINNDCKSEKISAMYYVKD